MIQRIKLKFLDRQSKMYLTTNLDGLHMNIVSALNFIQNLRIMIHLTLVRLMEESSYKQLNIQFLFLDIFQFLLKKRKLLILFQFLLQLYRHQKNQRDILLNQNKWNPQFICKVKSYVNFLNDEKLISGSTYYTMNLWNLHKNKK
ncbi:unnamed protein product [Paramecium pentaurelia]|uniref:Uncharacterized protein n=1 Tax=Paramecium pentaurelia TaxID=43138 RepID=A0A8S1XTF9_9CILI|nr:unnamed protein product [Paramecium pentaurelia]